MSFHCLGDWEASNGQRYVALMDTHASSQTEDDPRPRYRCAVSIKNYIREHFKLRRCGPMNEIIDNSDFKLSKFDRRLRSDSNDDIVSTIAIWI